jgi:glycosyltransferase involved in cell wall biosynthesis
MQDNMTNNSPKGAGNRKAKILLEMRPALEGFAGIPQETRLLFRGLCMIDSVEVEGMIQTSGRLLARGTGKKRSFWWKPSEARRMNRYSRVIVSMAERPFRSLLDAIGDYVEKKLSVTSLTVTTLLRLGSVKTTRFESSQFRDFTWRTFFSKTLPASDFDLVTSRDHEICSIPWETLHTVGLNTLNFLSNPLYPRLDTDGVDIFIGQTPYPARISKGSAFVIRYHDAIPVFMPHTIANKSKHQATHFYALMSNVASGAYFACVSESTRQDLLKLFPQLGNRAVTIHNMVSHHYFLENSSPERVAGIVRTRLHGKFEDETKQYGLIPSFFNLREQESFYRKNLGDVPIKYLLIVSTVEPRKNHARLMAAWEVIKADVDPEMKLIIVGTLGWDYKQLVKGFSSWIDRGELFVLNAVPAPDLRVLYRHAAVTVCPSLGEGFDYSGVEAMRCGGLVAASDIPVHREIYGEAAEYFDPYSTMSLVGSLRKLLYSEDSAALRDSLRASGMEVSARYLPERILPQWNEFLGRVLAER